MNKTLFFMLIAFTLIFSACNSGSTDGTSNQAPYANAGEDQSIIEGDDVTFDGSASSDDGSVESYVWDSNNTELNASMIFTKNDFTVGIHYITLTVTDNQGAIDTDEVIITVNTRTNLAPIANGQNLTTNENVDLNIILSAMDGDGDALTYTIDTLPINGAISGTLPNLTYIPATYYYGSDSFSFKVNDGTVYSQSATVDITINDNIDIIFYNNKVYYTVISPYTDKVWLDRNIGASQVCTAFDDTDCYGDYYQWGRNFDGHQVSSSFTTSAKATDINNAGTSFILSYDWTTVDENGALRATNWYSADGSSVCPAGYRVPTIRELEAETLDEGVSNSTDAFSNFLKLPSAGKRNHTSGAMGYEGSYGYIWSSSISISNSNYLFFLSNDAYSGNDYHSNGFSVRCIKD